MRIKMHNFKLNDVVIVTKNPPNQIVKIKGDIGYIDEFQEAANEKGEVIKHVYFKTIELNSFCGGMGSVPIDCIEICNNPVYLKRFQEILEHQKKENEKYDLIQAFSNLERSLKNKEEEITKLKEKIETLNEVKDLLESNLEYNAYGLLNFKIQTISLRITKVEQEILKVKEEMSTPINQKVNWYLQNLRYG
jgi:hypothetical protein